MNILLAPHNLPFSLALALMALGAVLQVVAAGVGEAVDIAGGDAPDFDAGELPDAGFLGGALDWLGVGRLPLFMLLSLWCALFGLVGLMLQTQFIARTGAPLSVPLAVALSVFASLPLLKIAGTLLRPLIPRDESEAISPDSFLGKQATIELGVARRGHAAQAKLRDEFGTTHYVMVEPKNPDETFAAGSAVVLVARREHTFLVVAGVE